MQGISTWHNINQLDGNPYGWVNLSLGQHNGLVWVLSLTHGVWTQPWWRTYQDSNPGFRLRRPKWYPDYTIRPCWMRRLTLQEGYNRLKRSSTLNASTWFAHRAALPFEATMTAWPRLDRLISKHCITHFLKKWRFFQGRSWSNLWDQLVVLFGVNG